MTMEFPVKDQAEFDKLRAGEKINATVFVQGNSYWVGGDPGRHQRLLRRRSKRPRLRAVIP